MGAMDRLGVNSSGEDPSHGTKRRRSSFNEMYKKRAKLVEELEQASRERR